MLAILVFAFVGVVLLLLLLARSKSPAAMRGAIAERNAPGERRPAISPERFYALAKDLLEKMGTRPEAELGTGDPARFIARRRAPLAETRYIVFLEAAPPGEKVEQATLVELLSNVRAEIGSIGVLVTPYEIDRSGLPGVDQALELIDGARMRQLLKQHMPSRLAEIDPYRGFGVAEPEPREHPDTHATVPRPA